jgi:CRP/FNR family cyclic AMP-dependent transcriptional regulator
MAFSFEAALAKTELFAKVDPDHLSKFAEVVSPQTYNEGQIITRQGDLGTGLYVITRGSADVVINQGEADETVLATMGEGAFFGDMALLLERPRGATIVAKESTDCFVLHRADFKRLTAENSAVLWALAEIIAERLEKADAALSQIQH